MNVVCYGHPPDKIFRDTWGKIQKTSPELGLELHRSLDSFASRLRQPGGNIAVVLLYIADKKTLSDLFVVRPLLNGLPVVILLNDQEPEILKFSHELRPRVILYTCWGIKDICSVLQRCVGRYCNWDEARKAAARNSKWTEIIDREEKEVQDDG
jgi:hypothetical protein